jgi:Zn-dependent peptidase ImmA (M78 family)/transcriptional regulator with XRE-family HTH domain
MPFEFNPEMMILARESRAMSQTDLARSAHLNQATVSRLEGGILMPTPEAVEKIAAALAYPFEFFFQTDRVFGFNSSVFFHRKRASLPDKVLRQLHAQLNIRRIHVSRLLRATEISTNRRFQKIDLTEYQGRPDIVAQVVRGTWLLPRGPIRNVVQSIEDAGGIVIRGDFGTKKIDAISEWVPGFPPIFFVNSSSDITGDRLRRTLAHEIGHVILHSFPSPTMEKEADGFASEFLLPTKEVRPYLYHLTIPKLAELKAWWKVSMASLVQRGFELKTITDSQRRYLFIQLARAGYKTREPIETDVPIERPALIRELVDTHMNELGYSAIDLSKLLVITESEFRQAYLEQSLRLVS